VIGLEIQSVEQGEGDEFFRSVASRLDMPGVLTNVSDSEVEATTTPLSKMF
jgi:hypothetical protein